MNANASSDKVAAERFGSRLLLLGSLVDQHRDGDAELFQAVRCCTSSAC